MHKLSHLCSAHDCCTHSIAIVGQVHSLRAPFNTGISERELPVLSFARFPFVSHYFHPFSFSALSSCAAPDLECRRHLWQRVPCFWFRLVFPLLLNFSCPGSFWFVLFLALSFCAAPDLECKRQQAAQASRGTGTTGAAGGSECPR